MPKNKPIIGRKAEILKEIEKNPSILPQEIAENLGIKLAYTYILLSDMRREKLIQKRTVYRVMVRPENR